MITRRLDLKLILYLFISLIAFCVACIAGVYYLERKEEDIFLKHELARVHQELTNRTHAIISEVLLSHEAGLVNILNKTKYDLNLVDINYSKELSQRQLTPAIKEQPDIFTSTIQLKIDQMSFGYITYKIKLSYNKINQNTLQFICVFLFAFSILFLMIFSTIINYEIFIPIRNLILAANPGLSSNALLKLHFESEELTQLRELFIDYTENIARNNVVLAESAALKANAELARKVAHDIRSPLSALQMIEKGIDNLTQDKRALIRAANKRINDIASELLIKYKQTSSNTLVKADSKINAPICDVLFNVNSIVQQKRIEYSNDIDITLNINPNNSFGVFVIFDQIEFQTIFSNLINNSLDSFVNNQTGKIDISIHNTTDNVVIYLDDNGSGVQEHVLKDLGDQIVTTKNFSTKSGNGIGVYNAHNTIKKYSGSMKYISPLFADAPHNKGTRVEIRLSKANSPHWSFDKIRINSQTQIVVVDDDPSIHKIWQMRFNTYFNEHSDNALLSFYNLDDFKNWYINADSAKTALILIDHEFESGKHMSFDFLNKLGCIKNCIIVTNYFDEILESSESIPLDIKLLPKSLISYVPISYIESSPVDLQIAPASAIIFKPQHSTTI